MQVLDHPGCVWATAFTDRGELVTGCSDAVGRVWSNDPARQVRVGADEGAGQKGCRSLLLERQQW